VPGQVLYERTRVAVLNGADGVVFVADSQRSKLEENVNSLKELARNVQKQGKRFQEFPLVLQYNKRDLPNALPVAVLDKYLNPFGWSRFEACAASGPGVFDTLKGISKHVIARL
jgi:mutual gliding-motility protein MglA